MWGEQLNEICPQQTFKCTIYCYQLQVQCCIAKQTNKEKLVFTKRKTMVKTQNRDIVNINSMKEWGLI